MKNRVVNRERIFMFILLILLIAVVALLKIDIILKVLLILQIIFKDLNYMVYYNRATLLGGSDHD